MASANKIRVGTGQTLCDIAIQEYGCIEGLLLLIEDNNYGNIGIPVSGLKVDIRPVVPVLTDENVAIANEYAARSLEAASWRQNGPEVPVFILQEDDRIIDDEGGTGLIMEDPGMLDEDGQPIVDENYEPLIINR